MQRHLFLWFVLVMALLVCGTIDSATAIPIEGFVAREQLSRTARKALYQERFGELEKLAGEFRKSKAKFPDGAWKLLFFYNGFESPIDKSDEGWQRFIAKFDKWLKLYPESIAARVAAATAWLNYGWKARGSGFADTVTEEGWKLLHERQEKAYSLLSKKPADPKDDCPGRYDLLLTLAKIQRWDRPQFEYLFNEAVSFEPTYESLYLAKVDYLLPKWNGDSGEWQKFAVDAIKLVPTEMGNSVYARIAMSLWQDEFKSFVDAGISWPLVKQGLIDIDKMYPNSLWTLNYFCRLACAAGDKETARQLFAKIGNRPYWQAWEKSEKEFKTCQTLLDINVSDTLSFNPWVGTEDFRQLLQLAGEGDPDSQFQVGQKYYDCAATKYCASNVKSNYEEAVKWFRKAAEQGHVQAQSYLTSLYRGVGGLKPKPAEALRWENSAAYLGNESAAFSMAFAYYYGQSVNKDAIKAYAWFAQMEKPQELMKEVKEKLAPQELVTAEQEAKRIRQQIREFKEIFEKTWDYSSLRIPPASTPPKPKATGNLLVNAKWVTSDGARLTENTISMNNGGMAEVQVPVQQLRDACVLVGLKIKHSRPQPVVTGSPYMMASVVKNGNRIPLGNAFLVPATLTEKDGSWWRAQSFSSEQSDSIDIIFRILGQKDEEKRGSSTELSDLKLIIFPDCEEANAYGEASY